MNRDTLSWLMKDRMSGGYLDKVLVGEVKRLDVPLISDLQIREAGKILTEVGRLLGYISRYNWTERQILMEAGLQLSKARWELKSSPKSIGQKSNAETIS